MAESAKYIIVIVLVVTLVWIMSEVLFLDLFGIGRYNTRKKFPEVAKKMGLVPASEWSWNVFPEYEGTYQGHHVTIDHESASVQIALESISGLFLNTFGDRATFNTGNPTLDGFFKEREVPSCLDDAMIGNTKLILTLERFVKKWRRKMRKMDVESEYVECRMKYGNGHYIPASVVQPLVTDLISIATLLQKACHKEGSTQ